MVFLRRWLLILSVLVLGGGQLFAAGGAKEQRDYAAAVSAFNDEMFARAAMEFAQFIQKYRNSTNVPSAVLLQAQAEFKQGKFTDAIARLTSTNNLAKAGMLADQYTWWAGEARFAAGNLAGAVDTFVLFQKTFPDSPLKLRVAVETATVYAQLGEWGRMISLLRETNGVFQRSLKMDPDNELVLRGQLFLARAEHMDKNTGGAAAILESRDPQTLPPELDWQWANLLFQVKIGAGDLNAALASTTNLLQIARLEKRNDWGAEGLAARAGVLEKLNLPDEAVAAYRGNLTNTAPVEKQQQAILKIAELAAAQNQFANAEAALENFLAQFPNSPAVDIALLTLGELHLKDYDAGQPGAVNHLTEAQSRFDQFLGTFKSSPLAGKAYLDRGWCRWLAGKIPAESLADFKIAAQKLPPSEDLAVARFKTGDASFKQKDFAGALQNYRAVLDNFKAFPAVGRELGVRALYQSLRACLELGDRKGAGDALAQIVENYPADESAQSGALLLGEAATGPQEARAVFERFEQQFPGSPLRAQVELAVARTYERESDWPAAIMNYQRWLENYPTNSLRPQADYALAGANFQAGNEPNALALFTGFVTQFPNSELAPQAQWWVADHFFRAGNFTGAETNYEFVFQNTNAEWQGSALFYPAQLMAGHAAMGRFGYNDASRYFTGLINDSNCPPGLDVQARFAYGSALMLTPDMNSPRANFSTAISVFAVICQKYPTNEWSALAQGEMGDCYLQLTNYDAAMNAYAQVFSTNSPADISARSQAQVGFGIALEKKAALVSGDDRTSLLQQALDDCYLKVFDTWTGKNLRDGEVADPFWVKKAGLQALTLIQMLGAGAPDKFIDQMEELFPQSKDSLEKKRAALPPAKN